MAACCCNKVEPEDDEDDCSSGPLDDRSCTDVLFLLLFAAFIVGMVVLFGFGVASGDPNRIISGYDVAGDVCGKENSAIPGIQSSGKNLLNTKYLYFDLFITAKILGESSIDQVLASAAITLDAYVPGNTSRLQYCLDQGAKINGRRKRNVEEIAVPANIQSSALGVPVASRLLENQSEIVVIIEPNSTFTVWRTSKAIGSSPSPEQLLSYDPVSTALTGGGACRYCVAACPKDNNAFLTRCIPSFVEQSAGGIFSGSGAASLVQEVMADIKNCASQIILICAIGLGLSLVLTVLFRVLAQVIVYVIMALIVILCIGGTLALWVIWYLKKTDMDESKALVSQYNSTEQVTKNFLGSAAQANSQTEVNLFLTAAIIATVFTVVVLLILLILRKRIKLVIQLFKEAGAAVHAMPLLVLVPLVTVVVQAIIASFWVYGTLWIESAGTAQMDIGTGYVTYVKDPVMYGMRWYHIFGLLWLTQFCVASQHMIIAGSVAGWYFAKDKSSAGIKTILGSLYRLVRYHIGTVAFGSFIIALVQLIRIIMKYLESRVKKWEKNGCSGPLVKILVLLLKCCQCCMWCFEKCMRYLNINAYIITAIYGHNFCRAAIKAFRLLAANFLRVATINSVGTFVLILGKVVVVIATLLIGLQIMKEKTTTDLVTHPWAPLLVAGLFTYLTAHCFIGVYQMAIDTIFLCFCEDCEKNNGIDRPYFMSRGLMQFAENSGKALDALDKRQEAINRKQGDLPDVDD